MRIIKLPISGINLMAFDMMNVLIKLQGSLVYLILIG